MTSRFVKGKARTETPRLKDLHGAATAPDPSRGRDARGQFTSGNGAATERGAKQLIRESLGKDADADMVREANVLYRALLRDLPSDGASVRQLTASRARHVVMGTALANEATTAGLGTPAGMKLAEASRSHDLAAQRLAVTAYDLAVREATARKAAAPAQSLRALLEAMPRRHDDDDDDDEPQVEHEPDDEKQETSKP